ncbi:MAG: hypothetical protein JSV12_04505 [Candidatus Bathyarchaeota archaeon]|nr:MAG: hypothetical protein JSV12_04505 [Candidatus Bathyarchaeota archaeon]
MDWKPLDKNTLEYIGIEPRCFKCHIKLDDKMKGYSRSEKDELYCERCKKKVEREISPETARVLKKLDLTVI